MKSAAPLAAVAAEAPRARQRRVAAASDTVTQHRQQPQVSALGSKQRQTTPPNFGERKKCEPNPHYAYKSIPRGLPSWPSWLSKEGKNY